MTTTVFLPQPLTEDKAVAHGFQALSALAQSGSYQAAPVNPWMEHSDRCKCPYCR